MYFSNFTRASIVLSRCWHYYICLMNEMIYLFHYFQSQLIIHCLILPVGIQEGHCLLDPYSFRRWNESQECFDRGSYTTRWYNGILDTNSIQLVNLTRNERPAWMRMFRANTELRDTDFDNNIQTQYIKKLNNLIRYFNYFVVWGEGWGV